MNLPTFYRTTSSIHGFFGGEAGRKGAIRKTDMLMGGSMKLLFNNRMRNIDWIHLAPNGDHWLALVNTIINFLVLQNVGNFFSS
jgi:hypothetical protein